MSQYPQRQPQKIGFLDIIWYYKYRLVFYIIFTSALSFAVLYLIDAVPDEFRVVTPGVDTPTVSATSTATTSQAIIDRTQAQEGELPVRIVISKIDVDTVVYNPASTNNAVLNDYLLRGAVRYPGSGKLGVGNVFMFGHSSYLRVINNQAFKTFNDLRKLNPEDEIRVYSKDKIYLYKVTSVKLAQADSELVDIKSKKNMLTLSTCNVFGEHQERFVVEAQFITATNKVN
jgi:LPXTG-site transpeptidase (sortase) family protein